MALADAVGTAADDHHLGHRLDRHLILHLVGGVEVRGVRLELRRAGVHQLVGGAHAQLQPPRPHRLLVGAGQFRQLAVRKAGALGTPHRIRVQSPSARHHLPESALQIQDLRHVVDEPGIDAGVPGHFVDAHAMLQRLPHEEQPLSVGAAQAGHHRLVRQPGVTRPPEPAGIGLQAAQPLLKCLLEGAPERQHLAHALHLGGQGSVHAGKLLEREARQLHHAVVDGGLEAGGCLPGDVVGNLIQRPADGQLGGELGDREAGRLGGQRRGTRQARVHLDHHQRAVVGIDGELDVGSRRSRRRPPGSP